MLIYVEHAETIRQEEGLLGHELQMFLVGVNVDLSNELVFQFLIDFEVLSILYMVY